MITQVREIEGSAAPDEYNAHAVHPLQAWEWGEARKTMGVKIFRLGEYSGQTLINTFQLTIHAIGAGYFVGYLPRSVFPSGPVLAYLRLLGVKEHLIFIKIEPNETYSESEKSLPVDVKKSPHPLFPDWTQVLDMSVSEEELMKHLKQKTRYNIRLAEKKGVTVREQTDDEGYRIFERLYFETCKRQKYFGHTQKYHQIIFNALKKKSHTCLSPIMAIPPLLLMSFSV